MYKIFADECVHKDMVEALKSAGHEVLTAREAGMSGASDTEIFNYACKEKLVLFTFDRGFGNIFSFDILNSSGVLIELINLMEKDEMINIVTTFLSENRDLTGKLIIIGKSKIRIIER